VNKKLEILFMDGTNNKGLLLFILMVICCVPSIACSEKHCTLTDLLNRYLNEPTKFNEGSKSVEIDLAGLWDILHLVDNNVGQLNHVGISCSEYRRFLNPTEKIPAVYRIHSSGRATNVHDEYVILELDKMFGPFGDNQLWQLLVFRKIGDYRFVADILGANEPYGLELDFHQTPKDSLLFSVKETAGRGTGLHLTSWEFYRFNGGQLKKVLATYGSGHVNGWGMRFNRQYMAQVWPVFYTWPRLGMTYYIKYDKVGYYCGLENRIVIDLFCMKKNVVYHWDNKEEVFLFDKAQSELSPDAIKQLFDDGEDQFREKYRKKISQLWLNGSVHQKKWAKLFEETLVKE
jgi:hypothetical protein